mgnify:CR=1 FL=1
MKDLPKPHVMSKAQRELPHFPWKPFTDDLQRIMNLCCEVEPEGPVVEFAGRISSLLKADPPHWYNGILNVKGDADFDRDFAHLLGRGLGIQQQLLKHSTRGEPCSNPKCANTAIRRSHAIQCERVLRRISDNEGKVIRLYPNSKCVLGIEAAEANISSASVFPGFCSSCEVSHFQQSENTNQPPSRRDILLLCWRALLSVRYQKIREAIVKAHAANALIRSSTTTEELSMALSYLTHMKDSLRTADDVQRKIKTFEADIFGRASRIATHRVKLLESPIVGAGIIPLGSRRKRECIRSHDWNDKYDFGAYNVTSDGQALYFVAAHTKRSDEERAFDNLVRRGHEYMLRSCILTLLSGGGRNAYVAPDYWHSCSSETRMNLREVAAAQHRTPLSLFPNDPPINILRL